MGIHIYLHLDCTLTPPRQRSASSMGICACACMCVCVLGRGGGHGRAFRRVVCVTSFGNDHIHLELLPGGSAISCHFAFGHSAVLCLT